MGFWALITRLGEAQIVLPMLLAAVLMMLRRSQSRRMAAAWLALLGMAVAVTAVSKVAFIGWGMGSRTFNFTGISGHAMLASAVYPLLLLVLVARDSQRGHRAALCAGCVLALLIGASRVVVGAHSISEVLAGLALGSAVSVVALRLASAPPRPFGPMVPAAVALWLALMPAEAPASQAHSTVTQLALKLSGRDTPFTREDLLRHRTVTAWSLGSSTVGLSNTQGEAHAFPPQDHRSRRVARCLCGERASHRHQPVDSERPNGLRSVENLQHQRH